MAIHSATNNAMNGYINNQIKTQAAEKTKKTGNTVELSEKAKNYLSKLQGKYKNVDFIISDYSSDDEASKKLRSGNGEYNCIITPDLLEKMAADEEVAAKYETIIDDSVNQIDNLKETVKEKGLADNVKSYGVSVDGNGKVNYYVLLKDGLSKLNTKNDAKDSDKNKTDKNDKTDKSNATDKHSNIRKTTAIYGNTIDELLSKLEEYSQGKTNGKQKDELEITAKDKKEEETGIYKNYSKNSIHKHHRNNEKGNKNSIIKHMLSENEYKHSVQNKTFKYAYLKNTVEINKNKGNDFNGKV